MSDPGASRGVSGVEDLSAPQAVGYFIPIEQPIEGQKELLHGRDRQTVA